MKILKKIDKKTIIKFGSSLRITVSCLLLLFFLTLIGTYYQADFGLYAAQKRYFFSWVFFSFNLIPFPGAKLVLLVLTINLFFATFKYPYRINKIGILAIHYGIIFLLVSSAFTHYYAKESVVVLEENESTDVSIDYFDSELAIWEKDGDVKKITAYAANLIEANKEIIFEKYGLTITPIYYYPHASPANFVEPDAENSSGITSLIFLKFPKNQEAISPGGLFKIAMNGKDGFTKVILWEAENNPYTIQLSDGKTIYLKLQRKRYPLPFQIELIEFIKEEHFGTSIPKRFESVANIIEQGVKRKVRIYMNHPLRTKDFTFFQASFGLDDSGNKQTVLATVENKGYWTPYVASIMVGFGLIFHFILMFFKRIKKVSIKSE